MDDIKIKNEIEDILKGRATVKQAQEYLSRISEDDLMRLIPKDELTQLLKKYKKRNNFKSKSLPHISEKEKAEIWQNIISTSGKPIPLYNRIWAWFKENLTSFLLSFSEVPLIKYGIGVAVVILVLFPIIFMLNQYKKHDYIGTKGEQVSLQASLEFSIVGPDGKLSRPDQTLTERDTLAFRVNALKEGFCSLYVIYRNKVDMVIADQFMPKGVHDLNVGYKLTGNRGINTLVMLFASSQISITEKEKQKLIYELAHNSVSSIAIKENVISITYQKIEIK